MLCGKAHLLLKEVEEARNHYRKAITSNEKELLAWKVLDYTRGGARLFTPYVNTVRLCLWQIDVDVYKVRFYCLLQLKFIAHFSFFRCTIILVFIFYCCKRAKL